MTVLWRLIGTSIIAFVATNIDDILVLVVYFGRANRKKAGSTLTYTSIIVGQVIGFTVLVGFSMLGYLLGAFIDSEYLGLMGFLPIGLGVYDYIKMCYCPAHDDDLEEDLKAMEKGQAVGGGGEAGAVATVVPAPQGGGTTGTADGTSSATQAAEATGGASKDTEPLLGQQSKDVVGPQGGGVCKSSPSSTPLCSSVSTCVTQACSHSTLEVALVTIANGVDNISVYIPLLSSISGLDIVIVLTIFYLMLVLWFVLGILLVRAPGVAEVLTHSGDLIAPAIFILLGLYIFWSCGTFDMFEKWAEAI